MDNFFQAAVNIPPNTCIWLGLICALSLATSNQLIPQAKLVFVRNKMWDEPWRIITLFVYFGNTLWNLVQMVILISRYLSLFETNYMLHPSVIPKPLSARLDTQLRENLRKAMHSLHYFDYSYFVVILLAALFAAVCVVEKTLPVQIFILGPMLNRCIIYIYCRMYPNENFFYFGFPMRARYSPWISAMFDLLMASDYDTWLKFRYGGFYLAASLFLTSEYFCSTAISFIVGHILWFLQYFLMRDVYGAWVSQFDKYTHNSSVIKTCIDDSPRVLLQLLFTPPWYYYVMFQILRDQRQRQRTEQVSNTDNGAQ